MVTAPEVAEALGVSLPTAHAALDRAGVPRTGRGHARTAPSTVLAELIAEHGASPTSRHTAATLRVLAALSRSPLGQRSARSIAAKAGISPTTASRVLRVLTEANLAQQKDQVVAGERARRERRWFANMAAVHGALADDVRRTRLPRHVSKASRLPRELHHLFWNADPATLNPATDGSYMAGRMLEAPDPAAWQWVFANISPADIHTAMTRRGIDPRTRRLAENWLAGSGGFDETERSPRPLRPTASFGGIRLASLEDIAATKLKAIQDRGALRDYFDLMLIDQHIPVEEALALLVEKYQPVSAQGLIANVVRGLGYLDDVENDPGLPETHAHIEAFWAKRQPIIAANI